MAENKFKTAAARLLAQHTAKTENAVKQEDALPLPKVALSKESCPVSPELVQKLDLVWQNEVNEVSTILPVQTIIKESPGAKTSLFSFFNVAIVILHAAIGCGIMFQLVPHTSLGIAGNITFGLLGGAVVGIIVAKIMK